jgi:hypothetical protein
VKKDGITNGEMTSEEGVDESSGYYYDDSTGYEAYDADADEVSEEQSESRQKDS